ncbi:MAG TPA: UDP-N-acetylmuramoyl-tripeptide--D-alanyl-D-alanine ligase [Actinomycetota bacterium]
MTARTLEAVASATGGVVHPADAARLTYKGVAVDSRKIGAGDLFVAISGEHGDGHRYVSVAREAGAVAAIVERGVPAESEGPTVEVGDTRAALLDLARAVRSSLSATVIGITGSTGKTCTKDFTAAVLRERLRVVASPASFNNEIGLPLTILEATPDTEAIVCEMGARGPGHIRLLCDVAQPQIGVVTNVGVAHMELFGSPAVLRAAKAELPESLPETGVAVLNADDGVVRGYASRTAARAVFFGQSPEADIHAEGVSVDRETGRATFELVSPGGSARVTLPVPGEHMVANALAATAVGWALDVDVEAAARGLSNASVSGGRMEVVRAPSGIRVINDAYNANPTSMAAALKAARWMAGDARCIAVLGTMAELGPIATEEHERIGELVVRLGIDSLITVGPEARIIAGAAQREGLEAHRIVICDDVPEAVAAVRGLARSGDLVLVKASRAAGLERVADALTSNETPLEASAT